MNVRLSPMLQLIAVGIWTSLPAETQKSILGVKTKVQTAVQSMTPAQREAIHAEVVRLSKEFLNLKA